jgi:hypothetical protein
MVKNCAAEEGLVAHACVRGKSAPKRFDADGLVVELLMVKRRIYKRDRRGRFASAGSSSARRISSKIKRRRPRYVRGSLGNTLRVGRIGPSGEYVGVHVGAKLRAKRSGEYYVGVSAGRRIATPYLSA